MVNMGAVLTMSKQLSKHMTFGTSKKRYSFFGRWKTKFKIGMFGIIKNENVVKWNGFTFGALNFQLTCAKIQIFFYFRSGGISHTSRGAETPMCGDNFTHFCGAKADHSFHNRTEFSVWWNLHKMYTNWTLDEVLPSMHHNFSVSSSRSSSS